MILTGKKVIIISLSLEELQKLLNSNYNPEGMNLGGFELSDIQKSAIMIKIEKMKKVNREFHDWFTFWIIQNKNNSKAMGVIGFKGINFLKEVEVGYGICEEFRRKGYVAEALGLLIDWAFSKRECRKIIAKKVLRENIASQNVLKKNGFEFVNETSEGKNYMKLRKKITI